MGALDDFTEVIGDIKAVRRRSDNIGFLLRRKQEKAWQKLQEAEQLLRESSAEVLGTNEIQDARNDVQLLESELEVLQQELYSCSRTYLDFTRDIDPTALPVDEVGYRLDAIKQLKKACDDLERRLEVARLLSADLHKKALSQTGIKTAERRRRRWDNAFKGIEREVNAWPRESRRRTAIAYCIVFESFLRDFLVEQAILRRGMLEVYIQDRQRLKLNLPSSLNVDDVVECIAVECKDFQDLAGNGKVKKIYESLFGKGPFGWDPAQTVFTAQSEQQDSLTDIRLLFAIRHQLIHRNGRTGEKYRAAVGKDEYRNRLHHDLLKNYPLPNVPGPDDILSPESKARALGATGTKLDEFGAALQGYAQYLSEVFQNIPHPG